MTTNMMLVADLHLHPDADRVPVMTPDEYDALVLDVEQRGVVVPLDILADGTILDGRHRWQVARNLGLAEVPVRIVDPQDPVDFMVRAAILRRHLTTGQRKALAASLIVAEPSRSDHAIGKAVNLDNETVKAVRSGMVTTGDVAETATRTDTRGRQQPATKSEPVIDPRTGRIKPTPRAWVDPVAPGPTLVPPASKEPRWATHKDMVLVPRMLDSARVLARVSPASIAIGTSSKDRPKMATRIREMIGVLESVAQAIEAGR